MIALLLLSLGLGQVPGPLGTADAYPPGKIKNRVLWATPPVGAQASPSTIGKGGPVTTTRSGAATYLSSSSTVASASANTLRTEPLGILAEPSITNLALQSADFSAAAWGKFGVGAAAPTISADFAVAPDGTTTADRITFPTVGAAQASFVEPAVGLTVTTGLYYTWSVWLATSSGTANVYLHFDNGTAPVQPTLFTATTTWQRVSITRNIGAPDLGTGSLLYPAIGIDRRGSESDQGGPVVLAWGAQLEQGGGASSYTATAGTSASRSADVYTVPTAGVLASSAGSGRLVVVPEWSTTTMGSDRTLLSTTNFTLVLAAATRILTLTVGATSAASAALTWTAGTGHTIQWSYTQAGTLSLTVDGVTTTGGSPGAFSPGANLGLCGDGSTTSAGANCTLRLCSTAGVCR